MANKAKTAPSRKPVSRATVRIPIMMTPEEEREVDDWQHAYRCRNRTVAIKALLRWGYKASAAAKAQAASKAAQRAAARDAAKAAGLSDPHPDPDPVFGPYPGPDDEEDAGEG